MRRTVRLLTIEAMLMIMMVALGLAASACGGDDRSAQTEQKKEESVKRQGEEPAQKEPTSQGAQPTQQAPQRRSLGRKLPSSRLPATPPTTAPWASSTLPASRRVEPRPLTSSK